MMFKLTENSLYKKKRYSTLKQYMYICILQTRREIRDSSHFPEHLGTQQLIESVSPPYTVGRLAGCRVIHVGSRRNFIFATLSGHLNLEEAILAQRRD